MNTRQKIVETARGYIDTPFAHMQRKPGLGIDCAGVLVCVARALQLVPQDFDVPDYTPVPDGRSMLEWCNKYMRAVSRMDMQAGDAIVVITDKHPQHLAILGDYRHGGFSIIHAANTASPPRVIETRLLFSRSQRFVAAYSLPGV